MCKYPHNSHTYTYAHTYRLKRTPIHTNQTYHLCTQIITMKFLTTTCTFFTNLFTNILQGIDLFIPN